MFNILRNNQIFYFVWLSHCIDSILHKSSFVYRINVSEYHCIANWWNFAFNLSKHKTKLDLKAWLKTSLVDSFLRCKNLQIHWRMCHHRNHSYPSPVFSINRIWFKLTSNFAPPWQTEKAKLPMPCPLSLLCRSHQNHLKMCLHRIHLYPSPVFF